MQGWQRVFLLPALLIAACVTQAPAPADEALPITPAGKTLTLPAAPAAQAPAAQSQQATASPRRSSKRINTRHLQAQLQQSAKPINIRHSCSFRNETGYKGSSRIEIANNQVRQLDTVYEIPERGVCHIEYRGFRQTSHSPSIELRHADGCIARIWTQGRQMTVSYSHCAQRCNTPQAFGYVWPLLIDQPSGRCD